MNRIEYMDATGTLPGPDYGEQVGRDHLMREDLSGVTLCGMLAMDNLPDAYFNGPAPAPGAHVMCARCALIARLDA